MVSAAAHKGAAVTLVHRLKYEASPWAEGVLATMVAPVVPAGATALIPVPRVIVRAWRYGIDPAQRLAHRLADHTGIPVVAALRPALWTARRAGPAGRRRGDPRFTLRAPAPPGSVLIDDVVTTGTTLAAAAKVCGVRRAVTITSAVRP